MKNKPRFNLGEHVYVVDFSFIRDKMCLCFDRDCYSYKVTNDDLALYGKITRISIEVDQPILYDIALDKHHSVRYVPEASVFYRKEDALVEAHDRIAARFNDFFSDVVGAYRPYLCKRNYF
jgi:hypothetical protein